MENKTVDKQITEKNVNMILDEIDSLTKPKTNRKINRKLYIGQTVLVSIFLAASLVAYS